MRRAGPARSLPSPPVRAAFVKRRPLPPPPPAAAASAPSPIAWSAVTGLVVSRRRCSSKPSFRASSSGAGLDSHRPLRSFRTPTPARARPERSTPGGAAAPDARRKPPCAARPPRRPALWSCGPARRPWAVPHWHSGAPRRAAVRARHRRCAGPGPGARSRVRGRHALHTGVYDGGREARRCVYRPCRCVYRPCRTSDEERGLQSRCPRRRRRSSSCVLTRRRPKIAAAGVGRRLRAGQRALDEVVGLGVAARAVVRLARRDGPRTAPASFTAARATRSSAARPPRRAASRPTQRADSGAARPRRRRRARGSPPVAASRPTSAARPRALGGARGGRARVGLGRRARRRRGQRGKRERHRGAARGSRRAALADGAPAR